MTRTRILTGVKPTGDLHLGNYFGAIKPCIEFSMNPGYEVFFLCADWHGLTDRNRILEPGRASSDILAALLTLGYKSDANPLLLQSQFLEIQEIAWYLACAAPAGLLERAHAYKDAIANGKEATGGLLYYPVLMAADIMTFDAAAVPVGKDQVQHLEYASDMARLFNNAVGQTVFHEPKATIQDVPLLPGIDGRKMSKSYNNHIPLFASKKELEKKIKEIKTDSAGLNDPKDPDSCLIFQILQSFASAECIAYMRDRLQKGTGYGYGHAKQDFYAEHERVFGKRRDEFEAYIKDPAAIWKKIEGHSQYAHQVAKAVIERARDALGLMRNFSVHEPS